MRIPVTQLESWEQLKPTVSKKRKEVFEAIETMGGATLFELQKKLGWSVNRISGRVTELKDLNLICDGGERRANPETSKFAIVWVVKVKEQLELPI